jgi:hypothetical protein
MDPISIEVELSDNTFDCSFQKLFGDFTGKTLEQQFEEFCGQTDSTNEVASTNESASTGDLSDNTGNFSSSNVFGENPSNNSIFFNGFPPPVEYQDEISCILPEDDFCATQFSFLCKQEEILLRKKKNLRKRISVHREKEILKRGYNKYKYSDKPHEQDIFMESVNAIQNEHHIIQEYKKKIIQKI